MKGQWDWRPLEPYYSSSVSSCYSYKYEEYCKLEMAAHLAITVVSITFIKVLILIFSSFYSKSSPLLTVGDGTSSFLTTPDPNTEGINFLQIGDMQHSWAWTTKPKFWLPMRQWRLFATTLCRCAFFISMCGNSLDRRCNILTD